MAKTTLQAKYSKAELIAAAETAFGVRPEVVQATLTVNKINEATKDEAAALIKQFLAREVK